MLKLYKIKGVFIYVYDGDYTSKFYPCRQRLYFPHFCTAKVRIYFDMTKKFLLKDVNRMLKKIFPRPSRIWEEVITNFGFLLSGF